jgi:hypothetical protein
VLREAASFGQPVLEYAPQSDACRDFEALADWLEEHHARPTVHIEVLPGAGAMQAPIASALVGAHADCTTMAAIAGTAQQSTSTTVLAPAIVPTIPPPPGPSRAAELARRVSDLLARTRPQAATAPSTVPSLAAPAITEDEARSLIGPADNVDTTSIDIRSSRATGNDQVDAALSCSIPHASISRLFGVRPTSRGLLFVQPLGRARSMSIAGEFNQWSADAHPMRRNDDAGVFERVIELPPGRHQYRLVIDGRWVADEHNPDRTHNSYGEANSIIDVAPIAAPQVEAIIAADIMSPADVPAGSPLGGVNHAEPSRPI